MTPEKISSSEPQIQEVLQDLPLNTEALIRSLRRNGEEMPFIKSGLTTRQVVFSSWKTVKQFLQLYRRTDVYEVNHHQSSEEDDYYSDQDS